ncbi:hypothetical protein Poli38472_009138 [Pythium oligandrum]|uniref:Uncharacterized protein n=1 Tax=Pythium oligandrum TaxID=41045 RepID=A0A8K1CJW7_PYTOL|nr:hypothetical protein Poli38472_009138 [Pythium oligandrum]|eukprot:TMW64971.1 hypothetical protein Poli38472_009138 [Pythium oligandrum]
MVLPVIITGGVVLGGASAYTMFHVGEKLALPSDWRQAPSKSFLGVTAGGLSAMGAYSGQARVLNQHFAHLMTYEVPAKVEQWGFRDFLRVTSPFIATRVVMVSVSVAVMGFVSTKVEVLTSEK